MVGKGSFGKVMMVKKLDSGEIFAMKVLKKKELVKRKQVTSILTPHPHVRYLIMIIIMFCHTNPGCSYTIGA